MSFEKMSQKEYAKTYGLSYTAKKSRIQRARKKMKGLFINCCSAKFDVLAMSFPLITIIAIVKLRPFIKYASIIVKRIVNH